MKFDKEEFVYITFVFFSVGLESKNLLGIVLAFPVAIMFFPFTLLVGLLSAITWE